MAVDDLELVRLRSRFASQQLVAIPRDSFVHAAVMRVLRVASKYLSDDIHYEQVRLTVETWLKSTGIASDEVDFDPAEVGDELGNIIVDSARRRALQYQATGRDFEIILRPITVDLVRTAESSETGHFTIAELPIVSAVSFVPGTAVRGFEDHAWKVSLHSAYQFDSVPELQLAWLLDHDADVEWWLRNQPRRFRLPTPAGVHSPDFIINWRKGSLLLAEVKGSIYWQAPDAEARIKARSAALWVEAQNALGPTHVDYAVFLDSDVEGAGSFADLLEHRAIP